MDNVPRVNLDLCLLIFFFFFLFCIQAHSYVTFQVITFGGGNFILVMRPTVVGTNSSLCANNQAGDKMKLMFPDARLRASKLIFEGGQKCLLRAKLQHF